MKTTLIPLALACALLAAAPVMAQQAAARVAAAPQVGAGKLVQDSGTRILNELDKRRAEFRADPVKLRSYISSEFDQVFDREYSARMILGLHARGASATDVKLFADAMVDNLISVYGARLLEVDGKPTVRVKGETPLPGGRGMKVTSEILRSSGAPVPVDYFLRNVGGQWKIFDVSVEGFSYVQNFKNQFDAPLRQKSIAQVAAELRSGKLKANADTSTN